MNKAIAALAIGLATPAPASDPDSLVTVVTSDQPQVQLMSMVLTNQAITQGHPTRILLCGTAADIALKDAPVEVCAIYLPGRGADRSVLIDGVGVAQPPAMAGALMGDDTIVWSF